MAVSRCSQALLKNEINIEVDLRLDGISIIDKMQVHVLLHLGLVLLLHLLRSLDHIPAGLMPPGLIQPAGHPCILPALLHAQLECPLCFLLVLLWQLVVLDCLLEAVGLATWPSQVLVVHLLLLLAEL